MLKEIKIEVELVADRDFEVIYKAISPENYLAPETTKVSSGIEGNKIYFVTRGNFVSNPKLKLSTIRRTVDDFIWSASLAHKVLAKLVDLNGV